jgi:hypothetical protein
MYLQSIQNAMRTFKPPVALAKVFTVTKNEYDLIEDFINYYGAIFGYENVVILDNESTDERVLRVYETYRPKGVVVKHTVGYAGMKQAEHFTTAMTEYKSSAEFLIGVDTDCFLCVNKRCNPEEIRTYLRTLPSDCDLFVMKKFLMSIVDPSSPNYKDNKLVRPTDCTTFVERDNYAGTSPSHVFYRASNFVSTDLGNHNGVTTTNRRHFCPEISYVHYHETGRRRHLERCRAILLAYGYIRETMSEAEQLYILTHYPQGSGIHRQRQYIQYLQNPDQFFKEDPIPTDTFEFVEVKNLLAHK